MMRIFLIFIVILISANGYAAENSYVQSLPNHQLRVVLNPEQHTLEAEDYVTLPNGSPRKLSFSLHRDLKPTSIDAEIKFIGKMHEPWLWQYSVTPRQGHKSFTIEYGGEIFHPPQQDVREARSFESTPGIIDEEGVVLNGDSGWYPNFESDSNKAMLTYTLEIVQPIYWRAISQGALISPRGANMVWQERLPQNEIHLIAGPLKEYIKNKDGIQAMVYLRKADAVLAQRYLDASVRYISMYQQLIGPYPYAKFALVENFWETGYGMPSFTLMGSQVIRLPFIIDTSFPHEILHNWWGNSVFVDYEKGNWSEGLTAYLADHLFEEQRGSGAEYRRSMLQKYADFVSIDRDFPLTQFTSRHSAQSEAVGYGKAMMMFHMLRRGMEDDRFILALQNFYKNYQFKQASFADVEESFSQGAGKNLQQFFAQWEHQSGAPQLRLISAQANPDREGYELVIKIEQTQPGHAYILDVPIAVTLAGEEAAYSTVLTMSGKQAELRVPLATQPLRVDVDPEFDLFRRLDHDEMPAAFSQVLGAKQLLVVLPRNAPEDMRVQYLNIAQAWQKQPSRTMMIKWDDELKSLPEEGAVWLFGWENRFRGEFQKALDPSVGKLTDAGAEFGNREFQRELHALALTAHIKQATVAWLAAPDVRMLPILARKLPHYAKFSYTAFESVELINPAKGTWGFPVPNERSREELTNLAKGTWPAMESPLVMPVRQADGSFKNVRRGKLVKRNALAR